MSQRAEKARRAVTAYRTGGGRSPSITRSLGARAIDHGSQCLAALHDEPSPQHVRGLRRIARTLTEQVGAAGQLALHEEIEKGNTPGSREFGESVFQNAPHHLADHGRDVDGLAATLFGLVQAILQSAQPQP